MAKLNKELARKVGEVEGTGSFEPLPAGVYRARLTEVTTKTASTGNPMWVTVFEVIDEGFKGRKLWNNLVLIEAALWKVREFFDAFGVETDTDTEELLGRTVKLSVIQRVINGGAREGQIGNNVDRMMPDDEAPKKAAPKKAAVVDEDDEEDLEF